MGKKMSKSKKRICEEMEKKWMQEERAFKQFYADGILEKITPSSDSNAVSEMMKRAEEMSVAQNMSQEDLEQQCWRIQENVKEGKTGNLEVYFDRMEQLFECRKLPLGNTIFKSCFFDDKEGATVLFIKKGHTVDTRVFIGGDNAIAVMATRKADGTITYTTLAEFHLLSIQENSDPRKETGLVTSYVWLTANVFSSIILASTTLPLKSLLLADWILAEWQRAKEASKGPSGEALGDDVDE